MIVQQLFFVGCCFQDWFLAGGFDIISKEEGLTCVCVFTLSCFLTKFVRPSLKLIGYMKEKDQDVEVEMFLGILFNCSMENVVCVCAASLIGRL